MSLIERAVARLSDPAQPNDDESSKPTMIEALADRLADRRVESPSGPAAESSVAPTQARKRAADSTKPTDSEPAQGPAAVYIDLDALRVRGMVVPSGTPTQASQEFRVIKRPLLANAFGRAGAAPVKNGTRIMVASALPREGKSYCAINLAMSIAAERDHGVILIDADIPRPSIPRELGIRTDTGLMDWLLGEQRDLSRLVLPTNVDRLSVLPAGRRHEQATELLASEAMERMLEQLTELYPERLLIFDSPPLLVTTESRVLASYMGQIVMVVEAGATSRDAVTQALAAIESSEVIAIILNKARKIETNGYYQGYGYGAS